MADQNRGEKIDRDLEALKDEMIEMTPEQQAELDDFVDPQEMMDGAEDEINDLNKRSEALKRLVGELETNLTTDELGEKSSEELEALDEGIKKAVEKRDFWKSTDSGLKKVGMVALSVLTAGSVLKPLQLGARKMEIGLDAEDWARVGVMQAEFTKYVVKGIRTLVPEAPFMGIAEKVAKKNIEIERKNLDRAKGGEGEVSLEEIYKGYLDMLPKDFLKNPDNIKLLGQLAAEAGGAIGGQTGGKIGEIGNLVAEHPEIAGQSLEKAVGLAKEGKLELSTEDMVAIARLMAKKATKGGEEEPDKE